MKPVTVQDVVAAVGGTLLAGDPDAVVTGVSTDNRTVRAGELFIPIVGEKHDGHSFIDSALASGAAGCLCARSPETLAEGRFYIKVGERNALYRETTVAYGKLAAWYRARFDIPVVQVTGSVGKTSTRDMIASVLSQKYRETLKTEGNYNNEIGTPRMILCLDDTHRAAVFETGMDGAGQIEYLGAMVKPDVAVITNVGDMHIEQLGSREGVFRAKCEIFEHLAPNGVAVLNGDDAMLNTVELPQNILRAGEGERCDFRVTDVEMHGFDGVSCVVTSQNARYALHIPVPGRHMIYAAAIAAAVGETLGLSVAEIEEGVRRYEPTGARTHVVHLADGRTLVDDCYNAGPQSMGAALRLLALGGGKNTVAVLGDMKELGALTEAAHREMGALAKSLGIGRVIAVGESARGIAAASGGDWYATVDEALSAIRAAFVPDTALLVKASHSMHFDRITEELMK